MTRATATPTGAPPSAWPSPVTFDALGKTVADDKPADGPALGRYRKRTA